MAIETTNFKLDSIIFLSASLSPLSLRLANSTSSSAVNNGILPISFKYIWIESVDKLAKSIDSLPSDFNFFPSEFDCPKTLPLSSKTFMLESFKRPKNIS